MVDSIPFAFVAALVLLGDPHAREQVADLPHGVHRQAGVLDLLEVGAARRPNRVVAAALAAVEAARLPVERPGDHAADRVLAGHHLARRLADRVELGLREHVDVHRELEHRVGRGVEDQLAGLQVVRPEVLDHLRAAVGPVAAEAVTGRLLEPLDDVRRKALRVGRQRCCGTRPSAPSARWWTPCRARAGEAGRAPPDRSTGGTPSMPVMLPSPRRPSVGRSSPPTRLRHVRQRVRVDRVAVLGRVRQRAHSAGVHDDHRRTCHCAAIMSMPALRHTQGVIRRLPHVDRVGIEERAATLGKRSIKTTAKQQGIRLAVSMVDLTTLEGSDTPGKVRHLCAKAVCPAPTMPEIPSVAAVCVYPSLVGVAQGGARRHRREGGVGLDGVPVRPGVARREAPRHRGRGGRRRRRDRHGHLARGVPRRRRRARDGGDRAREGRVRRRPPEGDHRDRRARLVRPRAARLDARHGGRAPTSSRPRPARPPRAPRRASCS